MKSGRRAFFYIAATIFVAAAFCGGCASVGSPDGGRYDEEPPVFKGSSPKRNATGVKPRTVTLDFDESVKIENAAEKVVVSPPMKEQPEIQLLNKRIQIKLKDTLRAGTTYSIDFADAIVDNNEGNPLGDFCFSFSTGDVLDTMEVSGYVLNASDLEPVKGMLVGVYSNCTDTSFTTRPFERVSRTDSKGHFVIRGLSANTYKVFALQDMDQNYYFSQKGEKIGWEDIEVFPTSEPALRNDTIWRGDGEVDTVLVVPYTRFKPDDIILRVFNEKSEEQYIRERSRKTHEKFNVVFAIPMDTLPEVKGINFDEKDAFIVERNRYNDSLVYWMSDSLLYYRDTLTLSMTYELKDSTGQQIPRTDTLSLVPAKLREQVLQDLAKKAEADAEKLEKEISRLEKSGDTAAIAGLLIKQPSYLDMSVDVNGQMDIDKVVQISFKEPVLQFEADSVFHVFHRADSLMEPMPIVLMQDSCNVRLFRLYAEWRPGERYQIRVDSASIQGIYGLKNNSMSIDISIKPLDQYSTFVVKVQDPKPGYVAQLYTGKDRVVRTEKVVNGSAVFYFVNPGKYYVRVLDDVNGNGEWDPGNYASGTKPESVFYLNKAFDLKANWDHDMEPWNVYETPLYLQKPDEAKSAEVEKNKKRESKNYERDKKIAEQKSAKIKRREERKANRLRK